MSLPKITGILAGIFCIMAALSAPVYAATTLSSSNIEVNESSSVATFIFTLTEPNPEGTTTIDYHTVDGSATAPGDYQAISGSITFPPSSETEYATVQIPLHPDLVDEQNEVFSLEITNVPQYIQTTTTSWTATIIDDDTPVAVAAPTPQKTTPKPTGTTAPVANAPDTAVSNQIQQTRPTQMFKAIDTAAQPAEKAPSRSAFVRSLHDPTQIDWSPAVLGSSILLAVLLILLIAFPAELFNGTLQENYDEISGWFKRSWMHRLSIGLHEHVPVLISLVFFTAMGALVNSLLSPDFGLNQASLALLFGMFITLLVSSFVFDVVRRWYMRQRFQINSRLRTHAIGLLAALILVIIARLFHFLPGYVYGVFTGIVFFGRQPTDKEDGHGLAVFSIVLLIIAAGGWFAWIPVRHTALQADAGFWVLVLDAALASLWVGALCSIVFGLVPMRFSNGEQVKKWNTKGWLAIYGLGMILFVHTLLRPDQTVYGQAKSVAWTSVLTLLVGFGAFSVLFWGYFRYRHLWRRQTAISKP